MKRLLVLFYTVLYMPVAIAQPAEAMMGHQYLYYQHVINRELYKANNRLGITHIASLIGRYNHNTSESNHLPDEIMNQAYLRLRVAKPLSVLGGIFFSSATGFRPSLSLQSVYNIKHLLLIAVPRIDIWKDGSVELFGLAEYKPLLNEQLSLYIRFQFMTSHGWSGHRRSYGQLRLGMVMQHVQFGLALNQDYYGPDATCYHNMGIFIRREIF